MPFYDDAARYSVKEAARILGIGEQSLRYYDRAGLLEPQFRDPDNSYRYYSISQFYLLEMFKYAKRLGLAMPDYRSFLISADQEASHDYSPARNVIASLLDQRRAELAELQRTIADLEAMEHNLELLGSNTVGGAPFADEVEDRWVFAVDHVPGSSLEETSVKLRSERARYQALLTERYGFLLDALAAAAGRLEILKEYVVLAVDPKDAPPEGEGVMLLPGGECRCLLHHCFCPEEPFDDVARALAEKPSGRPYLVADELGFYESVPQIMHAVRMF